MPLKDSDIFFVASQDGLETRKIRADNLFSGIADDWNVLVRDASGSKRCLVSELVDKASDDRYMLVNVNEPPTTETTLSIGPIVNVGTTTGVDYAPYVKLIDLNTGADVTNYSFQYSEGTPNDVFNGNEAANSKYYRGMSYTNADTINAKFVFTPPQPITVNGLIEVKGGFAGDSRDGVLKINGQVVAEINAFDLEPEWASAAYTGEIHTIEYHQKRYPGSPDGVDIAPAGKNVTAFFSITAFKIDGEYLISNKPGVTYLDFNPGTDFTDFSYNNEIKECDASENLQDAVGKIGEIKNSENRIVLLTNQPNWDVGNYACKTTITIDESNPIYKSYKVKSSTVVSTYGSLPGVPITSTFTSHPKPSSFAGVAATFDETFSSIQPTPLDQVKPINNKTVRFTVPVDVPSGSTLIVTVSGRAQSTVVGAFSMSDSQGNTYTSVIQGADAGGFTFPSIFMADINTSLSTSDTITLSTTDTVNNKKYMFGCIYVIDSQGVSVVDTDDFSNLSSTFEHTVNIRASALTVAVTSSGLGQDRLTVSNPDFTELVVYTEHQTGNSVWAWYLVGTDLGNGNPVTFDISERIEEYTDLSSYLEDTD